MIRVFIHSIKLKGFPSYLVFFIFYLCIVTFKIANNLLTLGKACDLIAQHKSEKTSAASPSLVRSSSPIVTIRKKIDMATSPTRVTHDYTNNTPVRLKEIEKFDALDEHSLLPLDHLGAAAIFANSNVDLKDASLNEELLKVEDNEIRLEQAGKDGVTKSFPDLQAGTKECFDERLKRSESVPSLNKIVENTTL